VEELLLVLFKKFIGKHSHDSQTEEVDASTPEQTVMLIQQGDIRLQNQFLTDYQPYVAKLTSQFCKRYIDPSRDDEFNIALGAFNEAIHQFSAESGRSFFGFAQTVIRRRLIDYVRKEQRHSGQIPMSSFDIEDEEDHVSNPIETHQALEHYEKTIENEARQAEIMELDQQLSNFGVSFIDLVDAAPKHADSRKLLFSIAQVLAENAGLMEKLMTKLVLPIKELLEMTEVSRKTIERNRKYLIAIVLIYHGPYPYLRDYLHIKTSGERSGEYE
jgi:RNA polymerase sigma factor